MKELMQAFNTKQVTNAAIKDMTEYLSQKFGDIGFRMGSTDKKYALFTVQLGFDEVVRAIEAEGTYFDEYIGKNYAVFDDMENSNIIRIRPCGKYRTSFTVE